MSKKKIHLYKQRFGDFISACGNRYNYKPKNVLVDIEEFEKIKKENSDLLCGCCLNTDFYKEAVSELEQKREATPEEMKEEFEVIKYEIIKDTINDTFDCPYKQGLYGKVAMICSMYCMSCKYNKGYGANKHEVKCSYQHKNKPKSKYQPWVKQYGISQEVVDYFDGLEFEVEVVNDINLDCEDCILDNLDCIEQKIKCEKLEFVFQFKKVTNYKKQPPKEEILKTIKAGNVLDYKEETLLKEPLKESEVPFSKGDLKPLNKEQNKAYDEIVEKQNHDSHWKKPTGELESIDKMEMIICHDIPEEYHETLKLNFSLALAYKYGDRLGKKDNISKEIDKMKNYTNRSVLGEWRK